MKLVKLQNKPLLMAIVIAIIGGYFYLRKPREGFADSTYKLVGFKAYMDLTGSGLVISKKPDLSGVSGIALVLDASTGGTIWSAKDGATSIPSGYKDYIIVESPKLINEVLKSALPSLKPVEGQYPMLSVSDITSIETYMSKQETSLNKSKMICAVIDNNGKYVDKNGDSVIGSMYIFGKNIQPIVFYGILFGIIVAVILLFMIIGNIFSKKSSANTSSPMITNSRSRLNNNGSNNNGYNTSK